MLSLIFPEYMGNSLSRSDLMSVAGLPNKSSSNSPTSFGGLYVSLGDNFLSAESAQAKMSYSDFSFLNSGI